MKYLIFIFIINVVSPESEWHISLRSSTSNCGGSLITPIVVVTSGSCFDTNPPSVDCYVNGRIIQRSSRIYVNPFYPSSGQDKDLALVKLDKRIQSTTEVDTIRLSTYRLDRMGAIGTDPRMASNTGSRTEPIRLKILDSTDCGISCEDYRNCDKICVSILRGQICKGDNGGGLTITYLKKVYLIGVYSHPSDNNDCLYENAIFQSLKFNMRWLTVVTEPSAAGMLRIDPE